MIKMKKSLRYSAFLLLLIVFASCSSEKSKVYKKTPVDEFITKYINEPNFSVILADMDYKEEDKSYYHKYRVLIEKTMVEVDSTTLNDSTKVAEDVKVIDTEWRKVSDIFFDNNINNLGMTIVSKKNGVVDKETSPAGYDNYVGNKRYGSWNTNSSGGSFWAFYGQYHFMSSLFYGSSHRYYRSDYRNYDTNHRGRTGYYGSGTNKYGTTSATNKQSSWSSRPNTFKSKVRNSVSKSATTSRSKSYSSSSKTQRNSSRYSSSSSSRSRSGGFGK